MQKTKLLLSTNTLRVNLILKSEEHRHGISALERYFRQSLVLQQATILLKLMLLKCLLINKILSNLETNLKTLMKLTMKMKKNQFKYQINLHVILEISQKNMCLKVKKTNKICSILFKIRNKVQYSCSHQTSIKIKQSCL